jgi:hypothetical protein
MEYPKYGNTVASRIKWKNKPSLIIIIIGGNDVERTKSWHNTPAFSAMYLGHEQFPQELTWPVQGCDCLIEWGDGPSLEVIKQVVECLDKAGASSVKIMPLIDMDEITIFYDKDEFVETHPAKRAIKGLEFSERTVARDRANAA